MDHETALNLIDQWHDHCLNTDGYDLTPILADIERVEAHLDAERERMDAQREAAETARRNQLQPLADALPRRRYRMVNPFTQSRQSTNRFNLGFHRTPIECGRMQPGSLLYMDRIVHGIAIDVTNPPPPEPWRPGELVSMACVCWIEAVVECTDEYADWRRDELGWPAFTPVEADIPPSDTTTSV